MKRQRSDQPATEQLARAVLGCGKAILIGAIMLLIIGVIGVGTVGYLAATGKAPWLVALVNENLSPLTPTVGPVHVVRATSTTTDAWRTESLDLYQMSLEVPSDWRLYTYDRRPEPTAPGTEGCRRLYHDCQDYRLYSPDNNQIIDIEMPCGFGDGAGIVCDEACTIASDLGNGNYLVRLADLDSNKVRYMIGGYGEVSDSSGTHQVFGAVDALQITYEHLGFRVTDLDDFEIPDRVVLSLYDELASFCTQP